MLDHFTDLAMQFTYRSNQIYRLDPLCGPHARACTLSGYWSTNVIDYLIVFALLLLVVALSMPTIIHLSAILRADESMSELKTTHHPLLVRSPASSPLSRPVDRALV